MKATKRHVVITFEDYVKSSNECWSSYFAKYALKPKKHRHAHPLTMRNCKPRTIKFWH